MMLIIQAGSHFVSKWANIIFIMNKEDGIPSLKRNFCDVIAYSPSSTHTFFRSIKGTVSN